MRVTQLPQSLLVCRQVGACLRDRLTRIPDLKPPPAHYADICSRIPVLAWLDRLDDPFILM